MRGTKQIARWTKKPFSRLRLLVAVVLFRPLNDLMHAMFGKSRFGSSQKGILDFVHETTNPALKVLLIYFAMFSNMDHAAWRPIGPWAPFLLRTTFAAGAKIMGHIFLRLIWRFRGPNFKPGVYVHSGATAVERDEVKSLLASKRRCCLGRFWWRFMMNPFLAWSGGLESQKCKTAIKDVYEQVAATNISSENRFARCRAHNRGALDSGSPLEVAHMCAKHLLAETNAWYELSKEQLFTKYKASFWEMLSAKAGGEKVFRDGYRAFMSETIAAVAGEGSFKNLGWGDLTEEQRESYNDKAKTSKGKVQVQIKVPKLAVEHFKAATPFGMGDDCYAIAKDHPDLVYASSKVGELKDAWQNRTGT